MSGLGKVLVTGGDGFIGSHLVEALVREGHDVRAFVQYNSFNAWGWLDHADTAVRSTLDVFAGDIRDPHGVRTAMQGCGTVLHLAALISIPFSYHSPAMYVETNIGGTLNIVQAAQDLRVAHCVVTSTSEVYGTARTVPITEDHPLQGQSPYAASKIGADQMALSFHRAFGTPVSVIRPFNTYGPRQSARAVIPTVITQILAGAKQIKLGARQPTRDFTYIEDMVAAFVSMAKTDRALGEVVNVGSNFEISVGDVALMIAEIMDAKVEFVVDDQRLRPADSEVERLWADAGKAEKLLGWRPTQGGLAGFRRGIEKTVRWFSDPRMAGMYKAGQYNI